MSIIILQAFSGYISQTLCEMEKVQKSMIQI